MSECNHIWIRTNGATTSDGYDTYRCERCGAKGKSFGLSGLDGVREESTHSHRKMRSDAGIKRGKQLRTLLKEIEQMRSADGLSGIEWSKKQYEEREGKDEQKT